MGTVFLAEQIAVGNRPVALKLLKRKLLDDPEFLLRFQNEAGSTGRIHHANVVSIYESGQADDGTPYIAMELLEGETLREALKRQGALPLPEAAVILQQAARGLNAAHRLGIIHRDLKPDNLFLTRGDEGELIVKVVDFGIAKLRESSIHTMAGTVLGTPAYMSCEQASGMRSDDLDARSDIYSLGIVVYEMLTGRVPFHSDTPLGYVRKHMLEEPPPFRAVAEGLGVPPAVESAVMKALVKDRDQRYTSALDFARELTRAAQLAPPLETPVPFRSTRIVPPPEPPLSEAATALPAPMKPEPGRSGPLEVHADPAPIPNPPRGPTEREEEERAKAEKRQRHDRLVNAGKEAFDAHVYGKAALLWGQALELTPEAPGLREAVEMAQKKLREEGAQTEKPTPAPKSEPSAAADAEAKVPRSPAPAEGIPETPRAQPPTSNPKSATNPPRTATTSEKFRTPSKAPGTMKLVALAGITLIFITAGVWYFVRQAKKKGDVSWSAKAGESEGEVRVNPNDGLKYVWIPSGTFMMGCSHGDNECDSNEKPPHQVTLTKGLWLGQTEVTVGAYKRFVAVMGEQMPFEPDFDKRPLNPGWGDDAMPMVDVRWDDAQAYCRWAGARLPTEAEWEYAARGGSEEARPGDLEELAWYADDSGRQRLDSETIWKGGEDYGDRLSKNGNAMHEVGQKRANGFGLYDMLGNVEEWANDWYEENYYNYSPSLDPPGPPSGLGRVVRGGSFNVRPSHVRVSSRGQDSQAARSNVGGFRCAGEVSPP
jgi:serine/threonine-protein kinase